MKSVQEILQDLVLERERMEDELGKIPSQIVAIQAQIAQCADPGDRAPLLGTKEGYLRRKAELPVKIGYNLEIFTRYSNGDGHKCIVCGQDIEEERQGKFSTCVRDASRSARR